MFINQSFTSHSGLSLGWKIDCDSLTTDDWTCIAKVIASRMQFHQVVGVPTGGLALAEALLPYIDEDADTILIVEDVLTTGASMEEMRLCIEKENVSIISGVVLFARTRNFPGWITPIFTLNRFFHEGVIHEHV